MLRPFVNYEEFLSILKDFDVSQNPFQSEAFYRIYFNENPDKNYLFLDISDKNGKRIGIVPFEVQKSSMFFRKYRFVGYRKFNYQQYICSKENLIVVHQEVYNYFQSQQFSCIVNYYDINDHTELFNVLSEDNCVKKIIQLYKCPYVTLCDSFDDLFRKCIRSSKNRSELKKFEKKLSQVGEVNLISINDAISFDKYKRYISQIFRIYSERFRNVYNTSVFSRPENRDYYNSLIEALAKSNKCYLSLLMIDDCVISFILGVCNEIALIDWIPAFDPSFSKYNVGTIHYKMLFEELCKAGRIKYFDFSKGTSVYKSRWAKEETINYQFLALYKPNMISAFIMTEIRLAFVFKSCLRTQGILEKIKSIIGKNRKRRPGEERYNFHINFDCNELNTDNCTPFTYTKIIDAPVEERKKFLDLFYEGQIIKFFYVNSKYAIVKFEAKENGVK